MDSGVVRLRKYHWQMVLIFLLKLIWFAGEACLLSRSEKSSRTSYRSPSNDWFWWCSQFWGSFRHNFKIAVGYLKIHCATCGIYLHLPELHFQIFLLYRLMVTYIPLQSLLTIWKYHTLPRLLVDVRALWTSQQSCLTGMSHISSIPT